MPFEAHSDPTAALPAIPASEDLFELGAYFGEMQAAARDWKKRCGELVLSGRCTATSHAARAEAFEQRLLEVIRRVEAIRQGQVQQKEATI